MNKSSICLFPQEQFALDREKMFSDGGRQCTVMWSQAGGDVRVSTCSVPVDIHSPAAGDSGHRGNCWDLATPSCNREMTPDTCTGGNTWTETTNLEGSEMGLKQKKNMKFDGPKQQKEAKQQENGNKTR